MASAALRLSAAMKSQIESRSSSASGLMWRLAILLRRQFGRGKSSTPARLDLRGKRLRIEFARRSAIQPLLDFRAQPFPLGFAALFALFDYPQPVAYDLACSRVAAARDQASDELFEMLADAVAGCHGH